MDGYRQAVPGGTGDEPAVKKDRKMLAHEKLTEQILEDFKGKITGGDSDLVVGENPENKFMVGMLRDLGGKLPESYSSEVTIDSMGMDFYLAESEIAQAEITVKPRGEFYYRCLPTYEQQKKAMREEVNSNNGKDFKTFGELLADGDRDLFEKTKMKLVPVYKKAALSSEAMAFSFKPAELLEEKYGGLCGSIDENHDINNRIEDQIYQLEKKADQDPFRYRYEIRSQVSVGNLTSEEAFRKFIESNEDRSGGKLHQHWHFYIKVDIRKLKTQYLVSVLLVNDSSYYSNDKRSWSRETDKNSIETLFNAGLDVELSGARYVPVELDYFLDDYKYDRTQMAVGRNCSVTYDAARNMISTENLPTYVQKRLVTIDKQNIHVRFEDLMDTSERQLAAGMLREKNLEKEKERERKKVFNNLEKIRDEMVDWLEEARKYQEGKAGELTEAGAEAMTREIDDFEAEINRYANGITALREKDWAFKSFILMNETFLEAAGEKYKAWRLFQIVFIVSLIPDIVESHKKYSQRNEPTDSMEDWYENSTLQRVSLLYFPTGGGKTEAFLGLLVFSLFFDRFRGKDRGVTALLRYPLRLLSIQQVQRVLNTLAQAELLRRKNKEIGGKGDPWEKEFSLGYYVGKQNTPNDVEMGFASDCLDKMKSPEGQRQLDDKYLILEKCPFCGEESVHVEFDMTDFRLAHVCRNTKGCPSGGKLPLYITDDEIYRYLPSVIISTVDKSAILGFNAKFRRLFSGASCCCPKHGFSDCDCDVARRIGYSEFGETDSKCSPLNVHEIPPMVDPAPTLLIQDELHLIRESLGTYASHYESIINYYTKYLSPSRREIKIIGATATISSYETQIGQLYEREAVRFPCASPYPDRNFYSRIDKEDTQRLVIGYAPFGSAIVSSVAASLQFMREVVNRYREEPKRILAIPGMPEDLTETEALEILEDYWIFLEYNNVKRDGNNVEGALETPINVNLRKKGIPEFQVRRMTGDETFQDVRGVLAEVESSEKVFDGLNLITATSMISHGVDADRFNIMFFYGVPGNTAEYVQAYSRTGRRYSSIVVDIIRPTRETDRSYLNHFVKFHEFKDVLIEAVPINRWAVKAIEGTLPGILAGLILMKYEEDIPQVYFMENLMAAIDGGVIREEDIKSELFRIYNCKREDSVGDYDNPRGAQYREKIEEVVSDIFAKIREEAWVDKASKKQEQVKKNVYITEGFHRMGYHIMLSLRDTDAQIQIALS